MDAETYVRVWAERTGNLYLPALIVDMPMDCILMVPRGAVDVEKIEVGPNKVTVHYRLVKPISVLWFSQEGKGKDE